MQWALKNNHFDAKSFMYNLGCDMKLVYYEMYSQY